MAGIIGQIESFFGINTAPTPAGPSATRPTPTAPGGSSSDDDDGDDDDISPASSSRTTATHRTTRSHTSTATPTSTTFSSSSSPTTFLTTTSSSSTRRIATTTFTSSLPTTSLLSTSTTSLLPSSTSALASVQTNSSHSSAGLSHGGAIAIGVTLGLLVFIGLLISAVKCIFWERGKSLAAWKAWKEKNPGPSAAAIAAGYVSPEDERRAYVESHGALPPRPPMKDERGPYVNVTPYHGT